MRVDGARILVTGATGGLGHAIARAAAARGAEVVLTGRRAEILEPLARELGGQAIPADLADRTSVETLVQQVGDVDIVVANAGLPASGTLTGFGVDEIDRVVEVNLRAPIVTARLVAEQMAARGRGHIVFVSSMSGKVATGGASLYSATKFGLRGFSLALREDLRRYGVGVSSVFPGFVRDAGMFAETGLELPRGLGTSSPEAVARAVIRAVERNVGEIDVAPVPVRLGARVAAIAPVMAAALQRRFGAEMLAAAMAERQAHKLR